MWFPTIFRRKARRSTGSESTGDRSDLSLPPLIFPRLSRLRLRSTQHLRGSGAGQRPSTRRRAASDFREHRKYVPGDDIRFVDWKASARSEQVFLKQGEQPQETSVHLLVDSSASMAWGHPPKRTAVLQLAAVLGYLALIGDDRLHLLPLLGGRDRPSKAGASLRLKGKGQFAAFWNALRQLPFEGRSSLTAAFKHLTANSRGGVVLVVSDLLDMTDLDQALAALPRPAWEVSLLHTLHPMELNPELSGEFEMIDVETGKQVNYDVSGSERAAYQAHLQDWLDRIEMSCIRHQVSHTVISTGWSLERETLPHLRRANLLEAV